MASLRSAASPTGTPGLRAKEPVGNAELWLPGPGSWEERAQETQGPDPQAPSQVRGTSPTQPASHRWQPGAPTVEIPGLPGERRGSAEARRPSAYRPGPELCGLPHGLCELGHVSTWNRSWSFPKRDSRAPSAPTCSQGSRTLCPWTDKGRVWPHPASPSDLQGQGPGCTQPWTCLSPGHGHWDAESAFLGDTRKQR